MRIFFFSLSDPFSGDDSIKDRTHKYNLLCDDEATCFSDGEIEEETEKDNERDRDVGISPEICGDDVNSEKHENVLDTSPWQDIITASLGFEVYHENSELDPTVSHVTIKMPGDIFSSFIDDDILDSIVGETNRYEVNK
ncbi:hypothetical protein JTB14_003605 [Gonioctena quinquepunctata]|nr:hypothetical protein JTB14_003605 [Gonioctena quinquepunctata]